MLSDLLDRFLRRNPFFPRVAWLRDRMRRTYHRWIDPAQRGLALNIGGAIPVRLPAEFCAREQEYYETEVAEKLRRWCESNPDGTVIDIGSSFGYFSCAALFTTPSITVIAIDGDLHSLKATSRVCQFATTVAERLHLLHCLVGPESVGSLTLLNLLSHTDEKILTVSGDPGTTNYVNLDSSLSIEDVPRTTLDEIVNHFTSSSHQSKILIKCDVEGAEQLVLEGAGNTLSKVIPDILLSVHSEDYLARFGGDAQAIRDLFEQHNYTVDVFAVDHEEHWWCTKIPNSGQSVV